MSMMVNRVSNVSFRANNQLPEDFLSRPGSFSKPVQDTPAQQPKKKHSALKVIAGTLVAAAVVAGSLYAAHKWGHNTFNAEKTFEEFKELDFFPKWKGYITTVIGKGGEAVEKAAISVGETCTEWWGKLFGRSSGSAAAGSAEAASGAAGEAASEAAAETLTEAAAEAAAKA